MGIKQRILNWIGEGGASMKKEKRPFASYSFLATCLAAMFMMNAQAYLDPAAASYLVQIVSGVVIACGVTVGIFGKRFACFSVSCA